MLLYWECHDYSVAYSCNRSLLQHASAGTVVLAHAEVTSEETGVEAAVRQALKGSKPPGAAGGKLELLWGHTLYHMDDLPFESVAAMPDSFTPFKNKCEGRASVRALLPSPKAGELRLPAVGGAELDFSVEPSLEAIGFEPPPEDARSVLKFQGGETAALARVAYYLWESDKVATYFDSRNGMLGGDYSTKFSPWLALGCMSPRHVYHELQRYEGQRTKNKVRTA